MKTVILFIFIVFSTFVYSQKEDEIGKTFVLNFLNEKSLILKDTIELKKIYNSNALEIETTFINDYNSDILFYKFELGKNKVTILKNNLDVSFCMSSCTVYILAYNIRNNKSYKLKGFAGNDLFFLLQDIRHYSQKKKSLNKILNELNQLNIGLDFKVVQIALSKFDFEAECLKICSDGKKAH